MFGQQDSYIENTRKIPKHSDEQDKRCACRAAEDTSDDEQRNGSGKIDRERNDRSNENHEDREDDSFRNRSGNRANAGKA